MEQMVELVKSKFPKTSQSRRSSGSVHSPTGIISSSEFLFLGGHSQSLSPAEKRRQCNRETQAAFRRRREEHQRQMIESKTQDLEAHIKELLAADRYWTGELHENLAFLVTSGSQVMPPAVAEYVSTLSIWNLFNNHETLAQADFNSKTISSGYSDPTPGLMSMRNLDCIRDRRMRFESKLYHLREHCLREGYDLQAFDAAFNIDEETIKCLPDCFDESNALQPEREEQTSISMLEAHAAQSWTNTRDRVNGWLLQSLESSETLKTLHKSLIGEVNMKDDEWARTVLKYWSLDEAATAAESTPCPSTEGAVGSHGGRHSARVSFTRAVEGRKRSRPPSLNPGDSGSGHVPKRPRALTPPSLQGVEDATTMAGFVDATCNNYYPIK